MNSRVLLTNREQTWLVLDGGMTAKGLQIGVSLKWPEKVFLRHVQLADSIIAMANGNMYPPTDVKEVVLEDGFPKHIEDSISRLKKSMDCGGMFY